MICKGLLGMALCATVAVACFTVRLQLAAHLATYDLARARDAIVELEEACDAVRIRVLALHAPERMQADAERSRAQRRARSAADEAARAAMTL